MSSRSTTPPRNAPGDPIASSTLALLYLKQGHGRRSRQVVDAMLQRDPLDGHALHLRSRLDLLGPPELRVTVGDDRLLVQWIAMPVGMHAVLVTFHRDAGGDLAHWVTSRRCVAPRGSAEFPRPGRQGHAIVCGGAVEPKLGFRPRTAIAMVRWNDRPAVAPTPGAAW